MKTITIIRTSHDNLFAGVAPSDMEGIDAQGSLDAFDELMVQMIQDEYPEFLVTIGEKTSVDSGDCFVDEAIGRAIGEIANDLWNRQDGFWRFTDGVAQ